MSLCDAWESGVRGSVENFALYLIFADDIYGCGVAFGAFKAGDALLVI